MSLLLTAFAASTHAQPGAEGSPGPALVLEWSGPGPELDCLGEDGLKRAVNEYLGRDAFEAPGELVLHIVVTRLPDRRFRAVVEVGDTNGNALGSREITSSTELCSSLDERLILAVALLADAGPEAAEAPPLARTPQPEPDTGEPDELDEDPSVARRGPSPRAAPWGLSAQASFVVEGGLLPGVRPGVEVGVALQPLSWLVARAAGLAFLPATKQLAGASTRFSLFAGTGELCAGELDGARLQTAICAGALYGGLRTATRGVTGGHGGTRGQLAGLLGFHVGAPLSRRWTLAGDATMVFPDRPERFLLRVNSGFRELFQMSKPSVLASFGAAFTF